MSCLVGTTGVYHVGFYVSYIPFFTRVQVCNRVPLDAWCRGCFIDECVCSRPDSRLGGLGGYIPILGWGEVNHENLCMRKRSLYYSSALTLPSNTIETPSWSMWNEIC